MTKKKCTRCKWHLNDYVNCTGYFGNPSADLVFVGEAFGKTEAETGIAFAGDAGVKLNELLFMISVDRSSTAIMNAMRCYQPGNPTPTKVDLETCFPYTYRNIQSINPKLVIALGASAFFALTGKDIITPYRGRLVWSDKIKRKVFVTWHPAACLYDPEKWKDLIRDFKKIPVAMESDPDDIKHYEYLLIDTIEKFDVIHSYLEESEDIYLDIETTGLSPYIDEINTIQLGTGEEPIFIITSNILSDIRDKLKFLENKNIIGQDFAFDAKFLSVKLDINLEEWKHDCCLAEYTLTGFQGNDLTYLTGKYAPESYGYDDEVKQVGGAHLVKDKKKLYQYGSDDIGVMYPIHRKQTELFDDKQEWFYNEILVPCNKVLTKMSLRGVLYNMDKLHEVDKKYEDLADDAFKEAVNLDAVRDTERHFKTKFNPRSYLQIQHLLLKVYGLPVLKTTKKDQPSITKDEMERYAKDFNNPYCIAMEQYRSHHTIRNNFLSGVIPKLVDNVAHTNYSLHATTTGRPASYNPNLLNLPRRDKDIKRVYVARPGYIFLYSDLQQIEVRIASVIYYDQNLIDICNTEGQDFHSAIASKVNNIPYDEFFKLARIDEDPKYVEIRNMAKTIVFGILYQKGAESLARDLNITTQKAEEFIRDYFSGFPDLERGIEEIKQHVIKYGWADTFFGFRRRWRNHSEKDHGTLRECVNFPIQGTAWNLAEKILIKVDKYLEDKKSKLVLQTYDSIVVEAKEEEVYTIAEPIKEIMSTINKPYSPLNKVNILADVEIGPNLADLHKI
uniref:DNA-directed DNA polymerase n=1 Tax=viral metagenome TaxID=1070528 RepID=A0A6H1ZDT7_9ZZZZ